MPQSSLRDARSELVTAQFKATEAQSTLEEHVSLLHTIHAEVESLEMSASASLEALADERKASTALLRQLTADESTKAMLQLRRSELTSSIEEGRKSAILDQMELDDLARRRDELKMQIREVETELGGYERELKLWIDGKRDLD